MRRELFRIALTVVLASGLCIGAARAQSGGTPALRDSIPSRVADAATATNATTENLAVFPWGEPQYTDGGANLYPRPSWAVAAWMDGGLWITNDNWYGWQPSMGAWQSDLATNRLLIHLDRALTARNLWMAVAGTGESNATLLAGFYDKDLAAVTEPMVLHVSATVPWFTNQVDLGKFPSASVISFSATNGMMRIFCSALFPEDAVAQTATTVVSSSAPQTTAKPAIATVAAASSMGGSPAGTVTALGVDVIDAAPPATVPGASASPHTWYVDATAGDDSLYDGSTSASAVATTAGAGADTGAGVVAGADAGTVAGVAAAGPKRTIAAVLPVAAPGDTIVVAAGTYPGRVQLDGVRMITNGRVVLQ